MPFQLPDPLPATVAELNELREQAELEIRVYQSQHAAGHALTNDDAAALATLLESVDTITVARDEAASAEAAHADQVNELMSRANAATAPPVAGASDADADAQEAGEAADGDAGAAEADAGADAGDAGGEQSLAAGASPPAPVSFGGAGPTDTPTETGPGWEMHPTAPAYQPGRIGFAALGRALDTVRPGSRSSRQPNRSPQKVGNVEYSRQVVATLTRDVEAVDNSHALVAAIERATTQVPGHGDVTAAALTAAGGWCAPSEQLYDFCDVPDATDLLSLPEITINRGGIRWPIEPDLSSIFESFQFFFTEAALEAEDGDGNPLALKQCVSIPCPDEFDEIRLNAVGYCVEAGILQTQGWPELITWFMQHLTQEHLRAISRRTILDVVNGSGTPIVVPPASVMGSVASVLNSLDLQATNVRLRRGLARNAAIEGIAPSWLPAVLRADLANRDGLEYLSVTDAQVNAWLTARNIALQYVGDWQTRDAGYPGNLGTLGWPPQVDVVMYPAGTWFRSMSPVIELGVFYPKEQLQVNRYTRFFTEDAIAVGRRCQTSIVTRIPLRVSGAIGPRIDVSGYFDTARSTFPAPSGGETEVPIITAGQQVNVPVTHTLATTGTPTAGTVDVGLGALVATGVAFGATATTLKAALVALDHGYAAADFEVTGGPLGTASFSITYPEALGALSVTPHLTGGSATVS